ncbi:MAG: hypothetical protein EOP45_20600 [Sphingobacteriaceae bacterium]|nr:MAG: hypothetical protein EOP45_20600 [Sphingobacteriaceae bacterium]
MLLSLILLATRVSSMFIEHRIHSTYTAFWKNHPHDQMAGWIPVYAPELIPILVSAFIADRKLISVDAFTTLVKSFVFHPRLVKDPEGVWKISDFLLVPSAVGEKDELKIQVSDS